MIIPYVVSSESDSVALQHGVVSECFCVCDYLKLTYCVLHCFIVVIV